jgi:hypothetical protein
MFTRIRIAAFAASILVVAAAGVFVVTTRNDFHRTERELAASQHSLAVLGTEQRLAVVRRNATLADLDRARADLATHTAARDELRATGRAEYRRLTAALDTVSAHRAQLAADTERAKRLDDCLVATSQVLNEAAVGDTRRLASTLPGAQRLCAAAAT